MISNYDPGLLIPGRRRISPFPERRAPQKPKILSEPIVTVPRFPVQRRGTSSRFLRPELSLPPQIHNVLRNRSR